MLKFVIGGKVMYHSAKDGDVMCKVTGVSGEQVSLDIRNGFVQMSKISKMPATAPALPPESSESRGMKREADDAVAACVPGSPASGGAGRAEENAGSPVGSGIELPGDGDQTASAAASSGWAPASGDDEAPASGGGTRGGLADLLAK